jgi:hypothetical protein
MENRSMNDNSKTLTLIGQRPDPIADSTIHHPN